MPAENGNQSAQSRIATAMLAENASGKPAAEVVVEAKAPEATKPVYKYNFKGQEFETSDEKEISDGLSMRRAFSEKMGALNQRDASLSQREQQVKQQEQQIREKHGAVADLADALNNDKKFSTLVLGYVNEDPKLTPLLQNYFSGDSSARETAQNLVDKSGMDLTSDQFNKLLKEVELLKKEVAEAPKKATAEMTNRQEIDRYARIHAGHINEIVSEYDEPRGGWMDALDFVRNVYVNKAPTVTLSDGSTRRANLKEIANHYYNRKAAPAADAVKPLAPVAAKPSAGAEKPKVAKADVKIKTPSSDYELGGQKMKNHVASLFYKKLLGGN